MAIRFAPVVVALAALALAAPAHATAPPLRGAATHPLDSGSVPADSVRELDALVAAHATAVRVGLAWSSLESGGKGVHSQWLVDKMDAFVAAAEARNLKVLVTFWGTPCWASSAPEEARQGCVGAWWAADRRVDRYPPADVADFADAAAWVAGRWGDDIAALELWNEPNLDVFLRTPTPAPVYASMLKTAYPAVKAAAPELTVIGPGMLNSDAKFLEALYAEGIQGYFDGISSHPFPQQYAPSQSNPPGEKYSFVAGVPAVRRVMESHGDGDRKMWFTEIGWTNCKPTGTSTWCVTTDEQTQNVGDALRMVRDRWDYVEGMFIYTLRNTGTSPGSREDQMGLLAADFTPKPSFDAFSAALADLAADPFSKPPVVVEPPPPPPSPPAPEQQQQRVTIVPGPPADRVAPRLSLLRVAPASVRAGRRFAVGWSLSEAGTVSLSLERLVKSRCGLSRKLCSRWSRAGTLAAPRVKAGKGGLKLATSLRGKKLKAGRYRLVAVGADAAGNRAAPVRAALSVR